MALPTKQKTWGIDPCNRISGAANLLAFVGDTLLAAKNWIKTISGVTVKGSSNGTVAAMDGTDRWTVSADVQTRGTTTTQAQSWIVFDFANAGGGELLMCHTATTQGQFSFYFSPGGNYAAAGTATHKPTATDEVTIGASVGIMTTSLSNDRLWSGWAASDGTAFFLGIAEAGVWTSFIGFQLGTSRCAVGVTFSPALVAFIVGSQTGHAGTIAAWVTARPACRLNPGGGAVNIAGFFGTEGYGTQIAPAAQTNVAELQGGGHNIYPVSMHSTTATARGAVLNFVDLWCGNVNAADGDTYPSGATRTFIQVADFVVAWDASVVSMS